MSDVLQVIGQPAPPAAAPTGACHDACCAAPAAPVVPDAGWLRAARQARWLAWASLLWMTAEGGVGLYAGLVAGSIALVAWALGSVIEGLASVIVVCASAERAR